MRHFILLWGLISFLGGCQPRSPDSWQDLPLETLQGEPVVLAEAYAGQRILLNYWATWCKPCLAEMPSLLAVHERLADSGYVFVLVSDEPAARIQAFQRQAGGGMIFLRSRAPLDELGLRSIPFTQFISSQGEVARTIEGATNWQDSTVISWLLSVP
jgi:thiol-disulfide isomerase/thioredoxin